MESKSECMDWLKGQNKAISIQQKSNLGPRFYAILDGQLIHHPGQKNGHPLGVIGPASESKFSFDINNYDIKKVDISKTPFFKEVK